MKRRALAMSLVAAGTVLAVAVVLRSGGTDPMQFAVVIGSSSTRGTWWTVTTFEEALGVRRPISLEVTVRGNGLRPATWGGVTQEDGAAEFHWEIPATEVEDIVVETPGPNPRVLARGRSSVPAASPRNPGARSSPAVPTVREGDLPLDLYVVGEELVPGHRQAVVIRTARPNDHRSDLGEVRIEPEPGLEVHPSQAQTGPDGWVELEAEVMGHVAALDVHVSAGAKAGRWYGVLPVARGGFGLELAPGIDAQRAFSVGVVAPPVRTRVYLEVTKLGERVHATSGQLARSSDGEARGDIELPGLPPGDYCLAASPYPPAPETRPEASFARPFRAANPGRGVRWRDLVEISCEPPLRWVVLDGSEVPRAEARARRVRATRGGLGAIAIGAGLEVLLVLDAYRRSRSKLKGRGSGGSSAEDNAALGLEGQPSWIWTALGLTLLGFLLLAAFLWSGSGG